MNSIFHVETSKKYSVTFNNVQYTYISTFNTDNGDSLDEKWVRLDKKAIKEKEREIITKYIYNLI